MSDFRCTRCGREGTPRLERAPFPTELGARVQQEICHDCFEEWKRRQMLLINHYGLKLHDAEAREYLYASMKAFLFGEGEVTDDIDPSEEGTIEW